MRVSIIILNYNGKDFIQDCIDSVLQSSYHNIEIIVLDNASNDNSFHILTKKYAKNSKVKLYHSDKQLHFTGGCNFAAEKATGKLLFFLNSDTVIDKYCIRYLVSFINKNNKTLVQPKILFFDNPNIIDNTGGYYNALGIAHAIGRDQVDYGQYDKSFKPDYVNGTAFMIPKNLFDRLEGFSKHYRYYYEDVDLCFRAKKLGYSCWNQPSAVVYHKNSLTFINNISIIRRKYYYLKNRFLTAIKHRSIFLILFLPPIWVLLYIINHLPSVNQLRFNELVRYAKKQDFSLLDLGAGNGSFVLICRNHKINALGVDKYISSSYITKSSIEDFNLNHKVDIVTIYHVLEHCKDPKFVLQKIKTFLIDDGLLVIEVPLVDNFTEKLLGKKYFAYHDKTHKHFFTKKTLNKLVQKSGFKIVQTGLTFYEFPATVLTTSIKSGFIKLLIGLILFIPFKILSLLGYNDEIIRLYCKKDKRFNLF